MRSSAFLGAAMAHILGSVAVAAPAFHPIKVEPDMRGSRGKPSKRIRTGGRYPHSSTRQRARYARQLAAGQLNIARVGE
ncbi:hypothetical protein [Hoeflea sp.]|uniref:hypothetical protein n=1 Tax=Hoeflea sp. TaxID=1940281 RepID=UPI003BAC3EDF